MEYKIIAGHKLSPNFDIYADTKNKKLLIAGLNNNIRIFSYNDLKECSIIENDIIKYSYNFINKKNFINTQPLNTNISYLALRITTSDNKKPIIEIPILSYTHETVTDYNEKYNFVEDLYNSLINLIH